MMTRRRKSPEQIVLLLGQADQLLANSEDLASVCRTLGIFESSFHRWRARYGGRNVDDAKRLKELEAENATLKGLPADSEVEKAALKEIARGLGKPACQLITTRGLPERKACQIAERVCCMTRCYLICGAVGCRWKDVDHAEGLSKRVPR